MSKSNMETPHDYSYNMEVHTTHFDNEVHTKHHQWICEKIKCERDKRRMYREITKIVMQWSIPAISGAVWYWLKSHWN